MADRGVIRRSDSFQGIDYSNMDFVANPWGLDSREEYITDLADAFEGSELNGGETVVNITAYTGEFDLAFAEMISGAGVDPNNPVTIILNDNAYNSEVGPTPLGRRAQENGDAIGRVPGINSELTSFDATRISRRKLRNYIGAGADIVFDIRGLTWQYAAEESSRELSINHLARLSDLLKVGGSIVVDLGDSFSTGGHLLSLYGGDMTLLADALNEVGLRPEVLDTAAGEKLFLAFKKIKKLGLKQKAKILVRKGR